ncbi:carbohydrate ABC transporter permease [Aestuariimicrobium kwangyangense]|uniref:carbohydrate ABC transporter permease n=1 Tax=Aestuariimicrobium kwangyangense TaxID=396389 RepID=UPI0003B7487E|nr:sugar ABC transporter permease [Aestuariimicrobium kwangyangense]
MSTTAKRRRRETYQWREAVAGYLFILPWLIGLAVFTVLSMGWSLRLSFQHYDLATATGTSAGLDNYRQLVGNPRVATALGNTFTYALMAVPVDICFALLLAMLLSHQRRFTGPFRVIYYLPKMTPPVATAAVFLLLLNGQYGAINRFLGWFGVDGPTWLVDPHWVKVSIVIMTLWAVGGTTVILLAALQNVPRELYESAQVDGANGLAQFLRITVPMISPTLFFLVITNTIGALQVFDQAYLLFYRDGNAAAPDAALFYGVYLYQQAFQQFNFGLAAAMSWLLFAILMVITAVQLKLGNRFVHYEGGNR